MVSPHGLDVDELLAEFDSASVARGTRYANLGRVGTTSWSDDGLVLTGTCNGSGDNLYWVTIGFDRFGEDLELARASCSCPVGAYCKHAVALLLTACWGSGSPPADRWRTVLANMLDELAPRDGEHTSPIGLEFAIAPPNRYRPGTEIVLRPVTVGKRGTWIRTGLNWQRLAYHAGAAEFDRRQYDALRALVADVQRAGIMPIGDVMTVAYAPPSLWSRLEDAVDAGVTIVAHRGSGLEAVDFIKSAQLRLDFSSDEAGGATMAVTLMVDGERSSPVGVGLVGSPAPHGIYTVTDGVLRLGRFDPVPARTTLDLVARNELVYIPAETVAEFSLDVLPRLVGVAPVDVEDGLFTPPTITGPIPVLAVKLGAGGVRAHWIIRYQVNDAHHDFDHASSALRTIYRDAAAEVLAWDAVTPALKTVAAAAHGWRDQAAQHVRLEMSRRVNAALVDELTRITESRGAAGAAEVASRATLCSGVDLTLAEAAVLVGELLPQLGCSDAFTIELDQSAPDFRPAENLPRLEFGSGDGEPVRNDWFDLSISLEIDGQQVPIAEVIAELTLGATHMLLPNGVYFRLDTPELLRLRDLIAEARALGEIEGGRVNAGSRNVTLWEELLALGVVDKQVAEWRDSLSRLTAARPPVPIEVPDGLSATLRDYQRDGLNWLSFLWDNELGGVLADDMGLGKTVQTLALIARVAEQGRGRFLVVAPTSVVTNWVAECHKFTPGLTAVAVTNTEGRSGTSLAEQSAAADIVVTSYALLRIDFEAYAAIGWAGIILDEAQFVKNHTSKTHQCVRRLDARFKLAITGTPMENNLMELWSLLSITAPGLFPSPKVFTDYFRKPIESGTDRERLAVLRRRIKPVMLRRTKSQVAGELPPKQEQVLTLDLGPKHRKIYDTHMARERQKVLGLLGEWEKNRFQIFRSLTLLRQLSLHAGLVDATKGDVAAAKVDFLVEQLPGLVAEGHSALVFSQFTGFLDILRAHLDAIGLPYSYLDGSSSSRQRDAAIRDFKAGTNAVFLISLKAGGFGLNLTEADYCFVCDPWWNPAAEAQAIDRTHRIGQTRPVTVYRLVSDGTIEEKVVALQMRKRELFTAVIDEGDVFGSAITASDVRELFG
ncbi:DEAD/DEAH box helicase [Mycolicibacterium sp.]|uniref:DEAD/DEAH box helicase n=1 Tax=Mycolicibacterium sp. TaxID=2320850 RepID=UPI001A294777|nr:DEAD/DEAH box helicase [Mycolicibacterium sp.]MBJ7336653.1 DEAD/DEAH box helicase [Mycolicibacterium sp.]